MHELRAPSVVIRSHSDVALSNVGLTHTHAISRETLEKRLNLGFWWRDFRRKKRSPFSPPESRQFRQSHLVVIYFAQFCGETARQLEKLQLLSAEIKTHNYTLTRKT
uniref:(northern house mosquito) hypothetical protein n=1 Tax=Culex pipiens TaxID=7175 RepID=A0A8D8B7M3_CULPI